MVADLTTGFNREQHVQLLAHPLDRKEIDGLHVVPWMRTSSRQVLPGQLATVLAFVLPTGEGTSSGRRRLR